MLFNSHEFIFLFLPVTLVVYYWLVRRRFTVAARSWLLFASLFFYSWWNIRYLPLILGSILFNYSIGGLLAEYDDTRLRSVSRKGIFVVGLTANLLLLGWFKYMDFFISTANGLLGTELPLLKIVLPLGISFFTITQIAFLVDAYEGLVEERNLLSYALFVSFFPHLLAGPILHHKEMMPQFDRLRNKVVNWKNLYHGLALFFIGLFKKVVLADAFSVWATAGFDGTAPLTLFPAWFASLSYTLQLYFDFSGYSDMAVGIGWLFNIQLPVNFNSPYKATGLIDFWKRWHITLTNFITTYLYTPILRSFGRITFACSLVAVFLSMLISGFWHGAGWTFIIWGGMHGSGLVINHVWRKKKLHLPRIVAWLITFQFVNLSFVFFRAKTPAAALRVVEGMAGCNGVMLNNSLKKIALFRGSGVEFGRWLAPINGGDDTWVMIAIALVIVTACRNSSELVARLRPTRGWLAILLLTACWALMQMGKVSEFLYFQF
jgi:D-alanyl-lipoteichoic acid acyltransferase DltB (MBOAT superfamily)